MSIVRYFRELLRTLQSIEKHLGRIAETVKGQPFDRQKPRIRIDSNFWD